MEKKNGFSENISQIKKKRRGLRVMEMIVSFVIAFLLVVIFWNPNFYGYGPIWSIAEDTVRVFLTTVVFVGVTLIFVGVEKIGWTILVLVLFSAVYFFDFLNRF